MLHYTVKGLKGGVKMKSVIDWIALILLVVGGLNWGLIGLWNWDLVAAIFGAGSVLANIVYVLVGISALWGIYYLFRE